MRKFLFTIMSFLIMCSIVGCSSTSADEGHSQPALDPVGEEKIQTIKDGSTTSYPDVTYGEAFESFFGDPTWNYVHVDADDPYVVEFTGYCTYEGRDVHAVIQFTVDGDSFEATTVSFDGTPQGGAVLTGLLQEAFESVVDSDITQGNSGESLVSQDTANGDKSSRELTMVDYVGMTVSEVADELGHDFVYDEYWWYGAAKPFMYEDQRVPYIFCFLDPELAGYAKGNEIVEFVEYYPNNGEYCTVAPGVQSNLTYNEIVEMNLEGDFEIVEEEGGDIGNTAAFWYYYDADTTVVFYWYEDHSPYTTPAESVTAFYD